MMLKVLFNNRLFIGALAFFILCVGSSLLYWQHVERQGAEELAETQERVKKLTEKQKPTTTEVLIGDTEQGGHFHEDGTWHADTRETEVLPLAEVSQPQQGDPSSVIAQESSTDNPITDPPPGVSEEIELFQQRKAQYLKDLKAWSEELDQAHTKWMQATEIDIKSPEEYEKEREVFQSLSESEKREIVTKQQAKVERAQAASERISFLLQNRPVSPTSPQAK